MAVRVAWPDLQPGHLRLVSDKWPGQMKGWAGVDHAGNGRKGQHPVGDAELYLLRANFKVGLGFFEEAPVVPLVNDRADCSTVTTSLSLCRARPR